MILPFFSRRAVLGSVAMLGPLTRSAFATAPDPILFAIQRTEAADLAFARAGLPSDVVLDDASRAAHRAHRSDLARDRFLARFDLHTMTPRTEAGASALVAFYARRAERTGSRGARRAGLRRLREVFDRPGACQPGRDLATTWAASLPALTHHPPD